MTTIRDGTDDDRDVLADLHRRSIRELADGEHSDAQIEAWSAYPEPSVYPIDDPDVAVLVAERDGDVAGLGEVDVSAGELSKLYVGPDHARAGVGRALCEAMIERAEEAGIETLSVEASRNAAPFYERMGFERVGRHTKDLQRDDAKTVETEVVEMERDC